MPYTMEDFRRDVARRHLDELTAEERVRGLSVEERLAGLPAEQVEAYLKRSGKKPATAAKKKEKPRR